MTEYYRYYPSAVKGIDLDTLIKEIPFEQNKVTVRGTVYDERRLTCFLSNVVKTYHYSGSVRESHAMSENGIVNKILNTAIQYVATQDPSLSISFNSCLANYYRNGNDKIGKHSDSERDIDKNSSIMSVSFGAPRKFILEPKYVGEKKVFNLGDGDILIMLPGCQDFYTHEIPAEPKIKNPRISLTFRKGKC